MKHFWPLKLSELLRFNVTDNDAFAVQFFPFPLGSPWRFEG